VFALKISATDYRIQIALLSEQITATRSAAAPSLVEEEEEVTRSESIALEKEQTANEIHQVIAEPLCPQNTLFLDAKSELLPQMDAKTVVQSCRTKELPEAKAATVVELQAPKQKSARKIVKRFVKQTTNRFMCSTTTTAAPKQLSAPIQDGQTSSLYVCVEERITDNYQGHRCSKRWTFFVTFELGEIGFSLKNVPLEVVPLLVCWRMEDAVACHRWNRYVLMITSCRVASTVRMPQKR
jgi:hypothetical protein